MDYTTERIIKIEGTEYLPKGYLELEPLLYKDEYEFACPESEKVFDTDQRKAKELRRQQYNNRNFAKVRDVVIIKVEYLKERARKILEQWFEGSSKPMDRETVEMFADELELDPETFQKLHDMFVDDRALFGKDKDEINRLIYNDRRQQTITRLATLVEHSLDVTQATRAFDPEFKPTEVARDRHAGTLPAERKRRSKHSRQRARMRSKSHDREGTPKKLIDPGLARKESGNTNKLRAKQQKLADEEQRLREICREAIKGEEDARLQVERALSSRKRAGVRDDVGVKEELSKAKQELDEFAELRKQAESALAEATREVEQVRKEMESHLLVQKSQAHDEIVKARRNLHKEADGTEGRRSGNGVSTEESVRKHKEQLESKPQVEENGKRLKTDELAKHQVESGATEAAKKQMKSVAVALIDRKVKEQEIRRSDARKEGSDSKAVARYLLEGQFNGSGDKSGNGNDSSVKLNLGGERSQSQLQQSQESIGSKKSTKKRSSLTYKSDSKKSAYVNKKDGASKHGNSEPCLDKGVAHHTGSKRVSAVEERNSIAEHGSQSNEQSNESLDASRLQYDTSRQGENMAMEAAIDDEAVSDAHDESLDADESLVDQGRPAYADELEYSRPDDTSSAHETLVYESMREDLLATTDPCSPLDLTRDVLEEETYIVNQQTADSKQVEAAKDEGARKSNKLEYTRYINKHKRVEAEHLQRQVAETEEAYYIADGEGSQVGDIRIEREDVEGMEEKYEGKTHKGIETSNQSRQDRMSLEEHAYRRAVEVNRHKALHADEEQRRSHFSQKNEPGFQQALFVSGARAQDRDDENDTKDLEPVNSDTEAVISLKAGQQDASDHNRSGELAREGSDYESGGLSETAKAEVLDLNPAHEDASSEQLLDERSEAQYSEEQRREAPEITSEELEQLLEKERAKIREQLQQEFDQKLARARQEAIEETMLRKDTYNKICRKQLWDMFLEYCREVNDE